MNNIPNTVYLELKSIINKKIYEQKEITFEEFKKMEELIIKETEEDLNEYKICS
jgi:hypothetical protein